jgi:hypothetical protein
MSVMRCGAVLCAAVIGLSIAGVARATVFFTDTFSYENGQLTAHNMGANVSGGLWVTHSPTPEQTPTTSVILVQDGQVVLAQPSAEDVNRNTAATLPTGSTWYYGAKVTVNDNREPLGAGPLTNTYFMHFSDGGVTNFRGRAMVTPGSTEATFKFGIVSSSSGTPPSAAATWATDLNFGTEYTILVGYTAADSNPADAPDGFSDLWVDPSTAGSSKISDTTPNGNVTSDLTNPMNALVLRQQQAAAGPLEILVNSVSIGDNFAEVLAALSPVAPANNSDFDNDGDVDGDDFLTWQASLGATGVPVGNKSTGDANGDGNVNAADLGIWQAHFGLPPSVGAAGAVPEPAGVVLVGAALASLGFRRRTR